MGSEVTNDKEDFMINKKEMVVYGINLTKLRKEYNDVINPKNSMTYTFWKEHVIETIRIGSNEAVAENLSHYLTNEERKKESEFDFGRNLLLSFALFFGSCFFTFGIAYFSMGSNTFNQLSALIEKADLQDKLPQLYTDTLPQLYTDTFSFFSNLLLWFTSAVIAFIGLFLFVYLQTSKDKLSKDIGFLRDLNQIIKDINRL